jgi:di/tricarboxylate transporter
MDALFAAGLASPWNIAVVLGLLALAIAMFASELLPVDIVTLLLLLVLIGTGILTSKEAFGGFSGEIIIILASIFVLCGALQDTGVVDAAGARLVKIAGQNETRLLIVLMVVAAAMSAFINNTTVVAMLVGPIVGLTRKAKISPSRILLPLAYASILGGTCTLIGTSTNVAVSGYVQQAHMKPIGLFEITPIGLILVGVGVAYVLIIGRYFLPKTLEPSLVEGDAVRNYLSEIIVMKSSPIIGQTIFRSDLARMGFRILKVRRASDVFVPDRKTTFMEGDILLVVASLESLMKVKTEEGIEIKPDWKMGDLKLPDEETNIAEAVVTPQSLLVGRTLKESNYHQQSGLTVLGIYRRGRSLHEKIGSIRLEVGDLLLVQGEKEKLASLQRQRQLAVLSELPIAAPRRNRGTYAVLLFGTALLLNLLGVVPLVISLLSAAVLCVILRCISVDRAYSMIDWRLLILIGGMTAFGTAMDKTGADELLAKWIVSGLEPFGVMAVLAGFFVVTILLTQPMSNAAAALVVLPVALEAARVMGVNERTFAIAIMLAASVSFITPFEPACILVYGPGRYRFWDFVKTGGPLTAILAIIVLIALPVFWPLKKAPNAAGQQAISQLHAP